MFGICCSVFVRMLFVVGCLIVCCSVLFVVRRLLCVGFRLLVHDVCCLLYVVRRLWFVYVRSVCVVGLSCLLYVVYYFWFVVVCCCRLLL